MHTAGIEGVGVGVGVDGGRTIHHLLHCGRLRSALPFMINDQSESGL